MPHNVAPASPVGVMPYGLCVSYSEELRLEALQNLYPDGSSDRLNLALNARRYFKMVRPVSRVLPAPPADSQWVQLYKFYQAHIGVPFYFYNLRETVPPWKYDPTGASPSGRYTVVFDGSWSEDSQLARSPITLALREVA